MPVFFRLHFALATAVGCPGTWWSEKNPRAERLHGLDRCHKVRDASVMHRRNIIDRVDVDALPVTLEMDNSLPVLIDAQTVREDR